MRAQSVITQPDAERLVQYLEGLQMPFTVSVAKGVKRSTNQNRLQRQWCNEVAAQLDGYTPENIRGLCKLTMGVPILRAENEVFAAEYDQTFKPLPYELKLKLMQEPYDVKVTSLMTVKQKTAYLDHLQRYWIEKGIVLTDPEAMF